MDNPNVGPTGSEQGNPWIDTMKDAPEFGEALPLEQAEQGQDKPVVAEGDGVPEAEAINAGIKDRTLEELWVQAEKTGDYQGFYENAKVVDRESQDASVLLSFCDINSVNKILASDSYGVLLAHGVPMTELFESDALFDEQYHGDGASSDYQWRMGDYREEAETMLEAKRRYSRGGGSGEDHVDRYADMDRTKEAKQAIQIIADTYFGENAEADAGEKFKMIVWKRTLGGPDRLTDEEKEFLKENPNPVADRLLYGPKVTNEERAQNILRGLDEAEKEFEQYGKDRDWNKRTLLSRFYYAANAIADYDEAGKPELVSKARAKLHYMISANLRLVVSESPASDDMEINPRKLILDYADALVLFDVAREYDLEQCGIGVEDILDAIDRQCEYIGWHKNKIFSSNAKALKELGASDEEIMERMDILHPVDFTGEYIKFGTDLLRAGIDRKAVLKNIYSADNPLEYNRDPFYASDDIDFHGRTAFSVLKKLGFTAGQIAETYNPEMIIKRLPEFIEQGANVKELVSYMLSYREVPLENEEHTRHGFPLCTYVFDKNHPEGRKIGRESQGDGVNWVGANIDALARQGIREEDIFEHLDYNDCSPQSTLICNLLDCPSFDRSKVVRMAFETYHNKAAAMAEEYPDMEDFAEIAATDPFQYSSTLMETYADTAKRERREQQNELCRVS